MDVQLNALSYWKWTATNWYLSNWSVQKTWSGRSAKMDGPEIQKWTVSRAKPGRSLENHRQLFFSRTVHIGSKDRPFWWKRPNRLAQGRFISSTLSIQFDRPLLTWLFRLIVDDLWKTYRWLWILCPMKSLILTFLPRTVRDCWVTIGATLQMIWTREILKNKSSKISSSRI